jgi:hypothetical protein
LSRVEIFSDWAAPGVPLGLADGVAEGAMVAVGLAVGVAVGLAVALALALAVGVAVAVAVAVGVAVAVAVGVGDGSGPASQKPLVAENEPPDNSFPAAAWPIVPVTWKFPTTWVSPPPFAITLCEMLKLPPACARREPANAKAMAAPRTTLTAPR